MSLRIIVQPAQVAAWITARQGLPVRRRGSDTDVQILFSQPAAANYETLSVDEFLETMKTHHRALLVDDTAGRTFHRFVERG